MNLVDLIIIILLAFGALIGFKNGFTKQLVSFIGFLVLILVSYLFKNIISGFLYEYLPFFGFGGVLKGVTVLNIALYEIIAFLVVFSILMIVFRILLRVTGIFEKILKFTIILGIPSKILGAIVGVVEYFCYIFIALYILSMPVFHIDGFENSKLKSGILNNTPILSSITKDGLTVFEEFNDLKEKYDGKKSASEFNLEALDLFLKYKVVTVESVDRLKEKGKLSIPNMETIVNKYREERVN